MMKLFVVLAAMLAVSSTTVSAQGAMGEKGGAFYFDWTVTGDTITFNMEGASNNYIALGLDNSGTKQYHTAMDTYACRGNGANGGNVLAHDYYSTGSEAPVEDGTSSLTIVSAAVVDNRISCQFTRPLAGGAGKVPATDHDLTTGLYDASYALGTSAASNWGFHGGGGSVFPAKFQAVGGKPETCGEKTPAAVCTANQTPALADKECLALPCTDAECCDDLAVVNKGDACTMVQCAITQIQNVLCYSGTSCDASQCCVARPADPPDNCNLLGCDACLEAQSTNGCYWCYDRVLGGAGCMKGLSQTKCHTDILGDKKQWKVLVDNTQCDANAANDESGGEGGAAATVSSFTALLVTAAATLATLLL